MSANELRFTEEHEWVTVNGDEVTVGITEYATEELGEIVFVDLGESGNQINQGDEVGSVESVKTVSGIFSPLTGEIVAINEELSDNPALINEFPLGDGWLFKIKPSNLNELEDLMSQEAYNAFIEE
ncbi:MAG: glycine cleavage system protein GcvH [bacterium]|nr:glycine cleavage system protein GcvH [bacterium]